MRNLTVVGLTGPTGAGKTTVLHLLEKRGAMVLDCDAVYHHLTCSSQAMRRELEQSFGREIYDDHGVLRRQILGERVFEDPQALEMLNAITHCHVGKEVRLRLNHAREDGYRLAVVDAVALIESGMAEICDVTIAVVASPQVRMERIMKRDGIDAAYARKRIQAQKPVEFFQAGCQYTLYNDEDSEEMFHQQAIKLLNQILNDDISRRYK